MLAETFEMAYWTILIKLVPLEVYFCYNVISIFLIELVWIIIINFNALRRMVKRAELISRAVLYNLKTLNRLKKKNNSAFNAEVQRVVDHVSHIDFDKYRIDKMTYHHRGSESLHPPCSRCNVTIDRKPASESCSL